MRLLSAGASSKANLAARSSLDAGALKTTLMRLRQGEVIDAPKPKHFQLRYAFPQLTDPNTSDF